MGYRYWKVQARRTRNYNWGEFAVYDLQMREVRGGPNLAIGGTAYASSVFGSNAPSRAFDGNPNTCWESARTDATLEGGHWIAYDFGVGADVTITEIVMRDWFTNQGRVLEAVIYGSNDNENWEEVWRQSREDDAYIVDPFYLNNSDAARISHSSLEVVQEPITSVNARVTKISSEIAYIKTSAVRASTLQVEVVHSLAVVEDPLPYLRRRPMVLGRTSEPLREPFVFE